MSRSYMIFGLQRSGTNFLQKLIELNFKARSINDARETWKHRISKPPRFQSGIPYIVILKDPYMWIESICDRNYVDWLTTQELYPADDFHDGYMAGKNNFNVLNLARTYKAYIDNWLVPNNNAFFVEYEDLLDEENRNKVLKEIGDKFKFRRKSKEWLCPKRVYQSHDFNEARQKYYKERTPKILTHKQKIGIKEILRGND